MIYFICTPSHCKPHEWVVRSLSNFKIISYPYFFMRRRLPRGTYIFSDFDRLTNWQVELAAHSFRLLKNAGCTVLNDPARVLHRVPLLRHFNKVGVNNFNAWPASELSAVNAFPVFLRTASAHRGNLTELLNDDNEARSALDNALEQGYPINDLTFIQYMAQADENGVFRKLAAYRIGDQIIPAPSVYQRHWAAKYGEKGVAGGAGYAQDLSDIKHNAYAQAVSKAFNEAQINYGRVDFGIVNGRPEFYEINTNPKIHSDKIEHPFPDRVEAARLSNQLYMEAMAALDKEDSGGWIKHELPETYKMKRWTHRLIPGYQWSP